MWHRECCFFCVCVCKRDTGDLEQPTTAGVAYLLQLQLLDF